MASSALPGLINPNSISPLLAALLPQMEKDQVLLGKRQFNKQQKQQLIREIRAWAQEQFPYVFTAGYFQQKEYSEQEFLKQLSTLLAKTSSLEKIKIEAEKITIPSRPDIEKLRQWQEEMKTQDNWLLQQTGWVEDKNTLHQLYRLGLDQQIKMLEEAHKTVVGQAMQ